MLDIRSPGCTAARPSDRPLFTPAEAAVLTRLSLKAVNNAIDKNLVPAVVRAGASDSGRFLDQRGLLALALEYRLAHRFFPELRRRIFDVLATSPRKTVLSVDEGLVKVDLQQPRRDLAASLRKLRRARSLVVTDPDILGGDPVFRGTRIPVHSIAAMLEQGSTEADILKAYPRVTPEMVRLASVFAQAYPMRGRPRLQPWRDRPPVQRTRERLSQVPAYMRFLVDECLNVELVTVVTEAGYEAHHVAHVGKAGWQDWNVMRHASENDFVLVTNNAADFRKLYAEESLHAGLVILIPNVPADLQKRLFKGAVKKLTEAPDVPRGSSPPI